MGTKFATLTVLPKTRHHLSVEELQPAGVQSR